MKKNTASQVVGAQMVSASDGSAFTGSVTVAVTGDGGTQATGSVGSGACTHEGSGFHTYAPAQAETNYDHVAFTFTGTGAIPATVQIYTTFPQTGDSFARLGAPAGASVSADVAAVKAVLPSALVSGRIDASVGAMANNVVTAAAIANAAIDAATFAADVDAEILSYLVDDATRIDASALNTLSGHDPGETIMGATDAVTVGALNAAALKDFFDTDSTTTYASAVSGSVVKEIADNAGGSSLTADAIADEVETRTIAGVTTVGTVNALANNSVTAAALAADAGTEIGIAVWSSADRELTALDEDNTTIDINGTAVGSVVGAVGSVTGAVGSVTGNVGGNVTGSVGSLAAQAKADVNAEIVDALATDTYAEPAQGAPGATISLASKIGFLFKAWRNKTTQTSSQYSLYNDDAATVDHKAAVSDDATTLTRGEVASGP